MVEEGSFDMQSTAYNYFMTESDQTKELQHPLPNTVCHGTESP